MKLQQIQEARYEAPDIRLTGVFYTGTEGEYQEDDVTIVIKRMRTIRHQHSQITRVQGAVLSVKGGKIAREVVMPNTSVRLDQEEEGWSLKGFTRTGGTIIGSGPSDKEYGDTWVLYDPNYITVDDLQEAKTSNQIDRAKKRYVYLVRSDRLKDFKPRITASNGPGDRRAIGHSTFMSDLPPEKLLPRDLDRVTFRVLISGAYRDVVQDDDNQWSDSRAQQFAKDFAEEHGIPYTDFNIVWPRTNQDKRGASTSWYIFSIKYNFQ